MPNCHHTTATLLWVTHTVGASIILRRQQWAPWFNNYKQVPVTERWLPLVCESRGAVIDFTYLVARRGTVDALASVKCVAVYVSVARSGALQEKQGYLKKGPMGGERGERREGVRGCFGCILFRPLFYLFSPSTARAANKNRKAQWDAELHFSNIFCHAS